MVALAAQLEVGQFVVGGISLGAGTALNLTVRYPGRVAGLVLCRPAWLDRPQAEFNRNAYAEIADLLDRMPTDAAVDHYRETRGRTGPCRLRLPCCGRLTARPDHPSASSGER